MLGKLATYLRMCGYDAAYALDRSVEADDRIRELARDENRLLLTRDRSLAERAESALLLHCREVEDQLRELAVAGFDLSLDEPSRCGQCNARLIPVEAGDATPEYAPAATDERVWRCPNCGQYFWKGSHWDDVAETLAKL